MKKISRRVFLLAASAAPAALCLLAPARGPRSRLYQSLPLRHVSAFYGPFIVDELRAGQPLEVSLRRGGAFVSAGQYGLGWLPSDAGRAWKLAAAEGRRAELRLESVRKDEYRRLRLTINLFIAKAT
jgi:hypothetical protein